MSNAPVRPDLRFFAQLASVGPEAFNACAQELGKLGDLASLSHMVDFFQSHFIDAGRTFDNRTHPSAAVIDSWVMALKSKEPQDYQERQLENAEALAFTERATSMLARCTSEHPEITLQYFLHRIGEHVKDNRVVQVVLGRCTPQALFETPVFPNKSKKHPVPAFVAAMICNSVDVSLAILRKTLASTVAETLLSEKQVKWEQSIHLSFLLSALTRSMRDGHDAASWVQLLCGILDSDPSSCPQASINFRMLALSYYLRMHRLYKKEDRAWVLDDVELLMGCHQDQFLQSGVALAIARYANHTKESFWMIRNEQGDESFDGRGMLKDPSGECELYRAVLSSYCTPLLPLFEQFSQASYSHTGSGFEWLINNQRPVHRIDLAATIEFLISKGHSLHAPLPINSRNNPSASRSALHLLAANWQAKFFFTVLPIFLECGADPEIRSANGQLPEDLLLSDEEDNQRESELCTWRNIVAAFKAKQQASELLVRS